LVRRSNNSSSSLGHGACSNHMHHCYRLDYSSSSSRLLRGLRRVASLVHPPRLKLSMASRNPLQRHAPPLRLPAVAVMTWRGIWGCLEMQLLA
jgi:hypothetical protein